MMCYKYNSTSFEWRLHREKGMSRWNPEKNHCAAAAVVTIRPSAAELSRPAQRDLPCPEPGCLRRFPTSSTVAFHVARLHRRQPIQRRAAGAVYACPDPDCDRNGATRKTRFPSLKALRQHYLKIHAPRTLLCPLCRISTFSCESLLRAHRRQCGADHTCSCGATYAHIASLRSHAAKHGHQILGTARSAERRRSESGGTDPAGRLPPLAPKPHDALHLLATIALSGGVSARRPASTCDAGTQTASRRPARRPGRTSGTQTRLTAGQTGSPISSAPAERQPGAAAAAVAGAGAGRRTAGSQCAPLALVSGAGRPPVWQLRPPGVVTPRAGVRLLLQPGAVQLPQTVSSCQTQTEAAALGAVLWEEDADDVLPQVTPTDAPEAPMFPAAPPLPAPEPQADSACGMYLSLASSRPAPLPAAGSQTDADTLSAQTQTQDPFDAVKHVLRADGEELFPELSELSYTDIQTQTPWMVDDPVCQMSSQTQTPLPAADTQTQTPWLADDPVSLMSAHTQTSGMAAGGDCQRPWLKGDSQTQTPWLTGESETQTWLKGDSQTQTPWLTGESETQTWLSDVSLMSSHTQTPWLTDDLMTSLMTSETQTAPVTHTETQTCPLCMGPCDCWGD